MKRLEKRIYLSPPHMSGYEQQYVNDAFATNWIAPLGPNVEAFEKEFALKVGIKSAVALSSGTAGIHLALRYLGIGYGDIVFCSTLTFAASCNPILYQGGEPVFIDSDPTNWNISPSAINKALKEYKKEGRLPKAVIVVNLYGQSSDMEPILDICEGYGVPIIEDSAESLGSSYKNKQCGTFGYFGIYSFNGNKIITTSGGGMLVSDNVEAIEKCRFWATQARDKALHYQHSEYGYNYRMSNVLAGIGRGQLQVLNERIIRKKEIYYRYKEAFCGIEEIELMPIACYGEPNYWLTVIKLSEKTTVLPVEIINALEELNIESRPVWKPMHLQPLYEKYSYYTHFDNKSVSDDLFNRGVCLPSGTNMTDDEQQIVIDCVKNTFNNN